MARLANVAPHQHARKVRAIPQSLVIEPGPTIPKMEEIDAGDRQPLLGPPPVEILPRRYAGKSSAIEFGQVAGIFQVVAHLRQYDATGPRLFCLVSVHLAATKRGKVRLWAHGGKTSFASVLDNTELPEGYISLHSPVTRALCCLLLPSIHQI